MIRKQTWILLVIFAALVGAAYYLTKNPLPQASGSVTPSATEPAKVLSGWQPGDIKAVSVKEGQNNPYKIAQDSAGSWMLDGKDKLDPAKVEEVSASLLGLQVQTTLDADYDQNALGLAAPAEVLTITSAKGQTVELRIGKLTPTESGYYAQSGSDAPVVLSKGGVDDLLKLVSKASLLNWTPTPEPSATPDGTVTPTVENAQPSATNVQLTPTK